MVVLGRGRRASESMGSGREARIATSAQNRGPIVAKRLHELARPGHQPHRYDHVPRRLNAGKMTADRSKCPNTVPFSFEQPNGCRIRLQVPGVIFLEPELRPNDLENR